jgi:hypothetical protein
MSVKLEEYIRYIQEYKQRHHGWASNMRHLANKFGLSLKEVGDLNMKCAEAGYLALLTPLAPVYEGNKGVDVINGPLTTLDEGSAGPGRPYWLLINAGEIYVTKFENGATAVCLFKSVMDAEEFRHSLWVPGKWKPFWPGSKTALGLLEDLVARGASHVAINPPPGGAKPPKATPIEVIIDHVASRGHIQDLDSP